MRAISALSSVVNSRCIAAGLGGKLIAKTNAVTHNYPQLTTIRVLIDTCQALMHFFAQFFIRRFFAKKQGFPADTPPNWGN